MAGKKMDIGPSGETVADNIKRVREAQRLTYTELSKRLSECGRSVSPLAVRRIEEKERRVDVDDLVAFAVSLGVTPKTLLMPYSESMDDLVQVTGGVEERAGNINAWMTGEAQLPQQSDTKWIEFMALAAPAWRYAEIASIVQGVRVVNSLDDLHARKTGKMPGPPEGGK
ncbi:transcriptional regulator with XRE-family HTH domain [Arthrobacter sp. UYNi723]